MAVVLVDQSLSYTVAHDADAGVTQVELPRDTASHSFIGLAAYSTAYAPLLLDFGPVPLSGFTRMVRTLDRAIGLGTHVVAVLHGTKDEQLTNEVALLAMYLVARYRSTPEAAYGYFRPLHTRCVPFHDASTEPEEYGLTVLDVLLGLASAIREGWFNADLFDITAYERMEDLDRGDRSWLIPDKFVALSSPATPDRNSTVPQIARWLRNDGVTHLVQLNAEAGYDLDPFRACGIAHIALTYPDGDVPPATVIDAFLQLMSRRDVVVAVHCKAGLGRTGTLACMWMIAEFGFTPRAAIGWARLCRPGCVIGPQQQFLDYFDSVVHPQPTQAALQHNREEMEPPLALTPPPPPPRDEDTPPRRRPAPPAATVPAADIAAAMRPSSTTTVGRVLMMSPLVTDRNRSYAADVSADHHRTSTPVRRSLPLRTEGPAPSTGTTPIRPGALHCEQDAMLSNSALRGRRVAPATPASGAGRVIYGPGMDSEAVTPARVAGPPIDSSNKYRYYSRRR